ncbi:MAG: hypothetical protein DWH79_11650 [Planctomycetota bacterium]|nr:MAG: hypothetical protein DWH79_11650 [Planctomycetota bacterium]
MATTIHQIFYDQAQLPRLDRAFVPYDNRANPAPEWREYHVFSRAYRGGLCPAGDVTGFVSWKFGIKTGVAGEEFLGFIADRPGCDVYFLNPPRLERRRYRNIWYQGERHHPGILGLTQRILAEVGVKIDLEALCQPQSQILFCNYWAGTRSFWDTYMAFCEPIRECIEHRLSAADQALIHSRADRVIDATYVPFIMERLFSTLLSLRSDLRVAAWVDPSPQASWWRVFRGRRVA